MELMFKGKRTREDILNLEQTKFHFLDTKKSIFFYDENINALANLYHSELKGKIDLIYIDPPFGTNNVFTHSEDRTSTISRSKEDSVSYNDKFSLDGYLSFMYERLVLLHGILSEQGTLYMHIDIKNGHYIKLLLDEIFGKNNFMNDISRIKCNPKNFSRKAYGNQRDMILVYSKTSNPIWNEIKEPLSTDEIEKAFKKVDKDGRRYTTIPLHAPGESSGVTGSKWRDMDPPKGRHWRTDPSHFEEWDKQGLIEWSKTGNPRKKKFADEHQGKKIQDVWVYKDPQLPKYPTEKNNQMLERIILQSSNESSYVLDCFAGSGGTLAVAHNNNRLFIGVDNAEHAFNIIQERLKSVDFEIYRK